MIEINLIPEEISQRKRRKAKQIVPKGFSIPIEAIIAIVGGVFVLIIFTHIILQTLIFIKFASYSRFKKEAELLAPEKAKVEKIVNDLRIVQQKVASVRTIVVNPKVAWAEILNHISDNMPQDVWLNKITLESGLLILDGSALARKQSELINVHEFTSNLKNEKRFSGHFKEMDLESIQRRKLKGLELADFSLTAKLK